VQGIGARLYYLHTEQIQATGDMRGKHRGIKTLALTAGVLLAKSIADCCRRYNPVKYLPCLTLIPFAGE
jgi:hypothetical protein